MPDVSKTICKEQDPLWRDGFSISKANERYVSRRQLAKFLTLASLGMFVGNTWILVRSWLRKAPVYSRSLVANVGEIPIGGVKLFQYPQPGEQCIMIRTAADVYVAYSQKCTSLVRSFFMPLRKIDWNAPVTRDIFQFRMAPYCRGHLRVLCRGLCWSVQAMS